MTPENQAKAQYTFDQVASHLIRQNKKSTRKSVGCAYRGDDGLRCAIGFCIPDSNYNPSMEGLGVQSMVQSLNYATVLEVIDASYCNDSYFMRKLQAIHDTRSVLKWPRKLKEFAAVFELDNSIVDIMVNAKLQGLTLPTEPTTL
jgi:hypothetical protein